VEAPRGSERRFASDAEIVDKYETLAKKILSPAKVAALRDAVLGMDMLPDPRQVLALLSLKSNRTSGPNTDVQGQRENRRVVRRTRARRERAPRDAFLAVVTSTSDTWKAHAIVECEVGEIRYPSGPSVPGNWWPPLEFRVVVDRFLPIVQVRVPECVRCLESRPTDSATRGEREHHPRRRLGALELVAGRPQPRTG
jgi:hypothetical protein